MISRRALAVASLTVVVAALVAGGWFAFTQHGASDSTRAASKATQPFLTTKLGPRRAASPSVHTKRFQARVAAHGYTAAAAGATVALSSTAVAGAWKNFAHGSTRSTTYGHETVTLDSTRAEIFETVNTRQGEKTWRWHLDTGTLKPSLTPDGTVAFRSGTKLSKLRVLPAAIYDNAGTAITPQGARWILRPATSGWWIELRLDDAKLPLPYVIDPAVDYPATQYFTSNVASVPASGGVTNGRQVITTPPASFYRCTAATACRGSRPNSATVGAAWLVDPNVAANVASTTQTALSAVPNGKGWIVDKDGLGTTTGPRTVIPSGTTWTVSTEMVASGTLTGLGLAFGVWKVTTDNAGNITRTRCSSTPRPPARRRPRSATARPP